MSSPEILAMAHLSSLYLDLLNKSFVFHRASDGTYLEASQCIRAIAAKGESQIGSALIKQLPALEIISVV